MNFLEVFLKRKKSTQNFEARRHLPEVFRSTFCMLTERRGKEFLQFVHNAKITWRNAIETCLCHYECIWRSQIHLCEILIVETHIPTNSWKMPSNSNCFGMKLALDGTRPSLSVQLHTPWCVFARWDAMQSTFKALKNSRHCKMYAFHIHSHWT